MQDLLRWLAAWKGVEVEPGTGITLEFAAWHEGGVGLLIVAGALLAFALVFHVYRRDGTSLTTGQRTVLASLRCAAILLALLILLEPNLVQVQREERPGHTILLLDVSQSMDHRDAYRRDNVQLLAESWRMLGVEPVQQTRMDLQRALLEFGDRQLISALAAKNSVRAYAFDLGVEPVSTSRQPAGEPENDTPQVADDLSALRAKGRYTNLGGAVRAALERSRDAAVAAVVLLTDGRRNTGPQGAEVARLLEQRNVPHTLVLGIGDPSETQTIELDRIEAPERVFRRDPFRVSAQLSSQGYDLTEVTVRLLREIGATEENQLLATKTVQVGGETPQATVEFDQLTSQEGGIHTYRVEVQPPEGEPVVPDRHAAHTSIEVLGEQTRVLLIAGGPSHEYRILRNTLIRDATIELRCWLSSADNDFPQDGNISIEQLPRDRAEMDQVDVLILIDPDAAKLSRGFCELAAVHVVDNGAGLWWVCGEKFTLDALRDSASTKPLADLLPVVPDLVRADRRIIGFGRAFDRPWPYALTSEGRESKVMRLVEQKEANALLWPRLAGHHFAFPVLRAKPLATTLVRLTNPDLSRSQEDMPLVAQQFVGAGRVLFCGTDETYRWRSSFEEAYNRYWVKGIRMLVEGRLSAGDSRLRIQSSEDTVELGEAVTITAQARDDAYHPLSSRFLELALQRRGDGSEKLRLDEVKGVPGEYAASVRPRETGFYTVSPTGGNGTAAGTSFQVIAASVERRGPADLAELASIASVPGGELLRTPRELLDSTSRIPSMKATEVIRTPTAIWDTWVSIFVILLVLATEWWLRKWFNLL